MARAGDVWRFPCPRCGEGRVLGGDGSGSHPPVRAFAVHDCFTCALPAADIAATLARDGLPAAREPSDHGEPLARRHYVEELARCERRFGPWHLATARCHVALARNYDTFGDTRGRDHHRAAWATYATTTEPDHPVWFEVFAALGYSLKGYAASNAEAIACYHELLRLYERALGSAHLLVADCLHVVGDLALATGDAHAAAARFQLERDLWRHASDEALADYQRGLPAVPPHIARTSYALHPLDRTGDGDFRAAQITFAATRAAAAAAALREPDIVTRTFGAPDVATALSIANALFQRDRAYAAALQFYEYAERLCSDPAQLAMIRAQLAMCRALVS